MTIWNKYKMIKELYSNENIKTYKAKIEPIIKEITPRNRDEYNNILNNLQNYQNLIYELIEENNKIYVVLLNDNINLDNISIIKEGYIGYDSPITKQEINELFLKERAMCKLISDNIENNSKVYGTGFFVKLNNNIFGLLTNNHIINNIQIGNTIYFYYLSQYKKIEITKDREVYTNKELDYTFIEIFKEDNIQDYFKINLNNINNLKYHNIFILQYTNNNIELSFSYGKINIIGNSEIKYNASTTNGSSGSPIILRTNDNLVIGIHHSEYCFSIGGNFRFNLGTTLNAILNDIKQKSSKIADLTKINNFIKPNQSSKNLLLSFNKNENNKTLYEFKNKIICVYNKKDKEPIKLLHDFKLDAEDWDDESKILYEKAKKNINENNIEMYINNKKIKFNYKYESDVIGQIKVKFKFKKLLTSTSYMFYECTSLESMDLSAFNTINVNSMRYMLYDCFSLKSIDLSSFNTKNVIDMSFMFYKCSSLKSINLSSFNTYNVTDMKSMFYKCFNLKSIDLSSFKTNNVKNMSFMFYECSSLKSLDLSSFKTKNTTDMNCMFCGCSSLESIDLSSFNTNNVIHMDFMFSRCSSLKKENVKLNKNEKKLLKEISLDCLIF